MLILLAAVVVLVVVPAVGGRWASVLELPLRALWLVASALAIQVLTISVLPDGPDAIYRALHVASYAMAGLFVWRNRSVAWLWLTALGGACNFLVIALNGGVMPASSSALRSLGRGVEGGFANSGAVPHAQLSWLGDVFATPSWFPLANVFSVGDVVLLVGFVLLVASASRQPESERSVVCGAGAMPHR